MGAFESFSEKTIDRMGGLWSFPYDVDIPPGFSPNLQNVRFKPGSVETRPGITHRFTSDSVNPLTPQLGLFQFIDNAGNKKIVSIDVDGALHVESGANMAFLKVGAANPSAMMQGLLAFNRAYLGFYGASVNPQGPLRSYDGTNVDHLAPDGPGGAPAAVNSATVGTIPAGVHKGRVLFETRSGYISEQGPEFSWTATGNFKVDLSAIPTGPDYVVARIIVFTAVGGEDFFYKTTFRIADNTTTTATLDFDDTSLLQGQNFNKYSRNFRLPDQSGLAFYNQRIVAFGGLNTVKMTNLDFDGGFASGGQPLGWIGLSSIAAPATGAVRATNVVTITTTAAHGFIAGDSVVVAGVTDASFNGTFTIATVPSTTTFTYAQVAGDATSGNGTVRLATFTAGAKGTITPFTGEYWEITGTGAVAVLGEIRNRDAATTLLPNTSYTVSARIRKRVNIPPFASSQNIVVGLFGTGVNTSGINLTLDSNVGTVWVEYTGVLTSGLASIPADLMLRVYITNDGINPIPAAEPIDIDRIQIWPTNQKFDASTLRVSDPENADRFDGINGFVTVSKDDGQKIVGAIQQRSLLYIFKERSTHDASDDGISPPSLWATAQVDSEAGAASPNAIDATTEFIVTASRAGAYKFAGGGGMKLSQEIQATWKRINWNVSEKIHTLIDTEQKVVQFFVPLDADTKPRHVIVLDYSEGWGEGERKWGLDAQHANTLGIHGSIKFETSTKRQAIYLAMEITGPIGAISEQTGTSDYGQPIDSFYDTAFVKDGAGGTDLFGGAAFIASGTGLMAVSLVNPDGLTGFTMASVPLSKSISTIARVSGIVTVSFASSHGFTVGQRVSITGTGVPGLSGFVTISTVPTATSFTYVQAGADESAAAGVVAIEQDVEKQANLETERAKLRFRTSAVGEFFRVKRVRIYCKEWAMSRVM